MNIKLSKGHTAAQVDIDILQRKVGMPLVSDFLEFVSQNDGAEPENNIFKIGMTNDACVSGFIPVKQIPKEMFDIENLPSKSFPIAWTSGGNYVIINQNDDGAVFFWDHEQPDNLIKLADNLFLFLGLIEPFDLSMVKLKPGQVKKAWIDPDFLKNLE